ncbi:MAG: GEVED domain-containing protein, partial [Bacteroidota bacterium]
GSFFRSANNRWQFYAPTGDGMIGAIDPKDDNYQYWTYQNGIINRTEFGQSTCISCNIPNDESGNGEWVTPFELDPSTPSTIFAGYKRIYRSFDRGDTWKAISLPLSNGLFDEIAISPSDGRYVYAIEGNRLFRTRNAGSAGFSQWTERKLPSGTISSLEVHPTERETLFITISGYRNGEKVYKSTDAGNNWINISGSLPNVPAMVIKAIRDSNYDEALFVGTGTGVFYREKGMDDWQEYGQLPHTLVMDIEFQYLNQSIRVGTYGRAIFEAALPLSPCFNGNGADADQDGVCDAFDICPNGNDLLDLDNDRAPDACETYCLAAGAAGTGDDYITAVRLNTINQQSEKSSYSDFRSVATELTVGNSYELSIQLNYAFPLDAAYAWIDFNQNREFESWEAIEMSSFNESHISTGVVTLPLDASPGKATLRVRNIYLENQIASPCDKFFGEVEDYTVNINALATNIASISNKTQLFKVFPNPGLNELNIFFEQANFQGPIYLAIVDFSGRTLIGRRYTADQIKTSIAIPTKDLASGIYIIKVQDQRQQSIQKWVRQ